MWERSLCLGWGRGGLVVAAELPPDCGCPALLQPICSASLVGDGDRRGGGPRRWVPTGCGGRGGGSPLPCESPGGLSRVAKGSKYFVPGRRGACASEDGLVLRGATFPCHLPSSLNASAIMINLSGTYEYADETLVSRLRFQEGGCVMGFLLLPPS